MFQSKRRFAILNLLTWGIYIHTGANAQISIGDEPIASPQLLETVSLSGTRAFPKEVITVASVRGDVWAVNPNVLYEAARHDPEFLRTAGGSADDVNSLSIRELSAIYNRIPPAAGQTCVAESNRRGKATKNSSEACHPAQASTFEIDAPNGGVADTRFVHLAMQTGAFNARDLVPIVDTTNATPTVFGVKVDSRFAKDVTTLYDSLENVAEHSAQPAGIIRFTQLKQEANRNGLVAAVTNVELGNVDVGRPYIFPAKEKNMTIEPSILRQFDVYWLQFAINPREDLRDKVDEISFVVALRTKDSEALALLPLRFGDEQKHTQRTNVPEIDIKAPSGAGVKIGQIYGQEIEFKSLKPSIVATGLQSPNFSWTLYNEMVDMSAKRLVAIIGIPKKTMKIAFDLIVSAKAKPAIRWIKRG